jgi:hypothetical protein
MSIGQGSLIELVIRRKKKVAGEALDVMYQAQNVTLLPGLTLMIQGNEERMPPLEERIPPLGKTQDCRVAMDITSTHSSSLILDLETTVFLVVQGDKATHPTAGNYTLKVALEEANRTYSLDLCPSQLKQVRINPCISSHRSLGSAWTRLSRILWCLIA